MPAIAVADALRAEGAEVTFVGGERAEAELVPAAGYPLDRIAVEGISRSNPLKAARAVLKAVGRARRAPGASCAPPAPDAVLGGGGYVAGPVGLAATLKRIPLVLTEADSHLGLTNRALASRARRVCLAFPLEGRDGDRYRVTGRPVPPTYADRAGARAELGIGPDETVRARVRRLARRALDQPGRRRGLRRRALPRAARRRPARLRRAHRARRPLRPARLPRARSGPRSPPPTSRSPASGGSVFELAQYGLPAVLIPYPHASPTTRPPTRAGWSEAGAARRARATRSSRRSACARRSTRSPRRRAAAAMSAASARWPGPTPRARSPPRCSAAAEARAGRGARAPRP